MRALATRPQRLALGIAVLTAAALGTVSASAAQATGTSTLPASKHAGTEVSVAQEQSKGGKHPEPPKGAAFAVAYHPTAGAPDDVNTADEDFAACMKDEGRAVFPHFHASKDDEGHVRLEVKVTDGDFDPTSKAYKKSMKACGPVLEKTGITFPSAPGLPPLPGKPGEPGGEGPSLHTEKGRPGDDLPGLTTGVQSA
ncbi:hypothetical protein [Streptomyces sp. NBC_00005]|uniref:hypothetical protein n=1 Tax=Streptomyces sp. NBC_00005 TaxID=2903609 RepID=UPI0032479D28